MLPIAHLAGAGGPICMGDGAIKFITDSIEAGNRLAIPATGAASPYGLWGQLGTRGMSEVIDKEL